MIILCATNRKCGWYYVRSRMSAVSVCLVYPVHAVMLESFDLETLFSVCRYIFRISRSSSYKSRFSNQGQGQQEQKGHSSVINTLVGGPPSLGSQTCCIMCTMSSQLYK